jgi:hypothetical protein
MVGVTGCGPDNEGEAIKAQGTEKDPGPINPKSVTTPRPTPASTQQEQFEQQQKVNPMAKKSTGGYYPPTKK